MGISGDNNFNVSVNFQFETYSVVLKMAIFENTMLTFVQGFS